MSPVSSFSHFGAEPELGGGRGASYVLHYTCACVCAALTGAGAGALELELVLRGAAAHAGAVVVARHALRHTARLLLSCEHITITYIKTTCTVSQFEKNIL